jgi:hypothetical protein
VSDSRRATTSGDGPDQRARSLLGRRNGGKPFAYWHPCFYSPSCRLHISPSLLIGFLPYKMGITPTFRCFRMAFPYGFLGRSHPSSGGKLFIDSQPSFLSDPGSPHVLPKLILVPPLQLRHRISLFPPSPEELPTDTRDALVSCCYGVGTPHSFGATIETSHCASFVPVNHKGTEPGIALGIATPNLSQWGQPPTPEVAPPSPLRRPMSDLHGYNEETGERSAPSSPSRRCFDDLPDTTTDKQLMSPLRASNLHCYLDNHY